MKPTTPKLIDCKRLSNHRFCLNILLIAGLIDLSMGVAYRHEQVTEEEVMEEATRNHTIKKYTNDRRFAKSRRAAERLWC